MKFQIQTTIKRIKACSPSESGWQAGLAAAGQTNPDELISYESILDAVGLDSALGPMPLLMPLPLPMPLLMPLPLPMPLPGPLPLRLPRPLPLPLAGPLPLPGPMPWPMPGPLRLLRFDSLSLPESCRHDPR